MPKQIYDKPVHALIREMVSSVQPGQIFTRQDVEKWFAEHYPKIKRGTIGAHLICLSTNAPSRVHHGATREGDLLFQLDGSHFRHYNRQTDPSPIYLQQSKSVGEFRIPDEGDDLTSEQSKEFAYERDLREFLSRNLEILEPGLKLFQDEEIKGVEFPVGGRFIDILAIDKTNAFVVIELKVSRGYDRVVGQLLRYMAWIAKNQAAKDQRVRGMIGCTPDLRRPAARHVAGSRCHAF